MRRPAHKLSTRTFRQQGARCGIVRTPTQLPSITSGSLPATSLLVMLTCSQHEREPPVRSQAQSRSSGTYYPHLQLLLLTKSGKEKQSRAVQASTMSSSRRTASRSCLSTVQLRALVVKRASALRQAHSAAHDRGPAEGRIHWTLTWWCWIGSKTQLLGLPVHCR